MSAEPEVIKPQAAPNFVLLHRLTFDEIAESKKPVVSMGGDLLGGPDRKGSNAPTPAMLWRAWQKDVQAASSRELAVPQNVMDYFKATKHLQAPPKEEVVITRPGRSFNVAGLTPGIVVDSAPQGLNLNLDLGGGLGSAAVAPIAGQGPISPLPHFATSYTGMMEFETCPRKFAASKYYKTVKYVESEAAADGNRGHATAENYLKNSIGGSQLPVDPAYLHYVQKYCDLFLKSGATIYVEREMCCTKDLKPCGWKDWNTVWFRGKTDVALVKDRKLNVADWKFGKIKDDPFQIEVMVALADVVMGDEFDTADGRLIFVKEPNPQKALVPLAKPILKADIPRIWEKIFTITNRMEAGWKSGVWRMQPSGLCKAWCEDFSCPHNGRRG